MSYRLERDEGLSEGIRRIAREQRDGAVESLSEGAGGDLGERIHDARKRFKKVRAVVRLVRDDVGKEVYSAINATFRDAGRLLSDLRDAAVFVETVDELRAHDRETQARDVFAELREKLEARRQRVRAEVEASDGQARAIAAVTEVEPPIDSWPVSDIGFDALAGGIRRVYRRGVRGLERCRVEPLSEHLHDWRKRVKYLWYHLRILGGAWPDVLEPLAESVHALAEDLGDDHDLAELDALLVVRPELADESAKDAIARRIAQRRHDLQASALARAQRLYAEPPKAFVERIGAYFEAWRS